MCTKLISLVVAVVCVAAATQASVLKVKGGEELRNVSGKLCGKDGNATCNKFNYAAMMACCPKMPTFMKPKSVADCKASMKVSQPSGKAPTTLPPPGSGGKLGGRSEQYRNRSCTMECVFKTEGLISTGADGKKTVNLNALNARLTTLAVKPWDGPINAAKANCTAAAPKVEGDQTCTSGAMAVTQCIYKHLMKSCPAPVKSTECAEGMKKMAEMEGKMEALKTKTGKVA